MTYANGDKMTATYNGIGQMVAEKWYNSSNELTAHYKYVYDGQGNIVRWETRGRFSCLPY